MIENFAAVIQVASSLSSNASFLESSISALESKISSLEICSASWERAIWIFSFAVAVGVAMELWVIRHEWRDEYEAWALAHFWVVRPPSRPSKAKLRVEIGSVLLIFIGVTGELGVGIKIASINGQIRGDSSELRTKSGQLVALLGQETAKLQRENIQLVEQVNPRVLTDVQRREITDTLSPFRGRSVTIAWVDPESHAFASQLKNALGLAGISVNFPEASKLITTPNGRIYSYTYTLPVETGVRINWPPEQGGFGKALGNALQGKVSELKCVPQAGVLPTVGLAPITGPPESGVLISVLTKPFADEAQHSNNTHVSKNACGK